MAGIICKFSHRFFSVLFAFVVIQQALGTTSDTEATDCIQGPSSWYNGTRDHTYTGILCQNWNETVPHKPKQTPLDGGNHNYCRNPDGDLKGTWCYTTNISVRWQYCHIPKCNDDSTIVWTNYYLDSKYSQILSAKADPEIVKKLTDQHGVFNMSILVNSENKTNSEYWALTGNYHRKVLFYTDYRSEYIGVRHLDHNITLKMYQGMAHGIENLAYDWVTRNLYWTDSVFSWIMVSEKTFQFYTPIYRTKDNHPPYALALHAKLRKLYFSTFKTKASKIIVTDMAGKNEEILIQYPHVNDVTGLTIDYTDDRLYWTDFTGYGGEVASCKMDGTNLTSHDKRGGAIFWSIASYLDYIFVTDVHVKYNDRGKKYYVVWVITKHAGKSKNVFRYTVKGKPRGIAVLSQNEERDPLVKESTLGECEGSPPCMQICLPRINATRECACNLGYSKSGETDCVPKLAADNFMYFVDAGQGKIFQIEMGPSDISTYSIVAAPDRNRKVVAVAANVKRQYIYWSDKRFGTIKRSLPDGSQKKVLTSNNHTVSLIVDQLTSNVFYVDGGLEGINVMTYDGEFHKNIMKGSKGNTSIKMITQDNVNRKIYWTDTKNTVGRGQVWRMNQNGENQELVYKDLHWPHAITIDHRSNNLYVAEARTGMIYEIPLSTLYPIKSRSPQSIKTQIDLAAHLPRYDFYINDIKVLNDKMFIADSKSNRIEMIYLSMGPASITSFGPSEFYSLTSMTIINNEYHKTYIDNITSPCKKNYRQCPHICVDISETDAKCLCKDSHKALSNLCVDEGINANKPPSAGSTCPENMQVNLEECAPYATIKWKDPVWTDDFTAAGELQIRRPDIPEYFSSGRHTFIYSASDAQGATGYCGFTVDVTEIICPDQPTLPEDMLAGKLSCGKKFGSMYSIRCKEPQHSIPNGVPSIANFTNVCQRSGEWLIPNLSGMKCVADGVPETTQKPVIIPTTTSQVTTKTTPSNPNPPNTKAQSTPPNNVTTSPNTKTQSTPPNTIITKTPSTKTTIKTKTDEGGSTTLSQSPSPSSDVTSTNKQDHKKGITLKASDGANKSKRIKSGTVAAICVVVILLVIIAVGVVIYIMRNRPSWKITQFSLPAFWNRKRDDEIGMNPNSEAPYSMMT